MTYQTEFLEDGGRFPFSNSVFICIEMAVGLASVK